jgi:hypothetical protein
MRIIVFLLAGLWALPFLAQNVPESTTAKSPSNAPFLNHRQQVVVNTFLNNENKKIEANNQPGMEELVLLVPEAAEGFITFKKKKDGSIATRLVEGKEALRYADSYDKKQKMQRKTAETEKSVPAEKAPIEEAVSIVTRSIHLGKNLQSRYQQYKNAERGGRIKLIRDLLFGAGKEKQEEEDEKVEETWHLKIFRNEKSGMLEVYANVTGLDIFVLDEEGQQLLKAGEVHQAFTELDPSLWPEEGSWIQFLKNGRVRVMKY